MSLLPGLYDHPLKRNSLEKPMFRKTAVFGHFGPICPFPVTESDRIWIQPGKESMTDGRADGQTVGHPESIGPQPLGLGPNEERQS